jgi:glycosyltransferase involved in cell wall biosynthesis
VIPAKNEEQRIAATVSAVRDLPGVATVVVVNDGSSDRTADTVAAIRCSSFLAGITQATRLPVLVTATG